MDGASQDIGSRSFTTIPELFLGAIEIHDRPDCFRFKSEGRYRAMSSREVLRRVAALASVLANLGIEPGDRVGLFSENRVEWALTDYAVLGLGAITVPVFPTLLEPDIEYILRDSEAKGVVVAGDGHLQKILNVWGHLPSLEFVLAVGCSGGAGTGAVSWAESVEAQLALDDSVLIPQFRARALSVRPEDTASILYTSGTMGKQQGVVLTHANLAANIKSVREVFRLTSQDVLISFLPLCHVLERMVDFYCFWAGVSIGYAESVDALPESLQVVRPTLLVVVPRVLEKIHAKVMETVRKSSAPQQALFRWAINAGKPYIPCYLENQTPSLGLKLKRALADRLIYSRIREQLGGRVRFLFSGSAPLSKDLAEFFFAIGLPAYEGYGLTETSPIIAVNFPGQARIGTVGRVIPGVEIKLDEEDADPAGGTGREILVRGPNVTPGYYHAEQQSRDAFVDGWLRTGDLGVFDADGFLTITGRKKNLFKTSGGKYVSPEKLENLFQGHPYIHQISVLGDARKFIGALIVPHFTHLEAYARRQGISYQVRDDLVANPAVEAFFRQHVDDVTRWLPPYEKIRQFVLLPREFSVASGELSATLKVKRHVLSAKYHDRIEEMFSRHAPKPQSGSEPQP